jgi:tetratricopeptide (TPR) repeat protein
MPPHVTRAASPATSRSSRLGERLRQLRVSAGLTQSDVAGERFSKEYVSQIERGKTRPTQDTIDWLAGRLGVDPSFLASGVSTDERARVEATLARAEGLVEARDFEQALEELERAAAPVSASGSPELEARLLSGKGWALHQMGQVREALPIFTRVRELVEDPSFSDVARADVLFRLAACRYVLSSVAMAVTLLDEALKLAENSGEPCDLLQARVLAWRSRCRRRQRDWDAAREDVERALELAEGLNDKHALAHINLHASVLAERNGQWVRSRSYAERARQLFEELSDRRHVGLMLNNLGGLHYLLGKPEAAVKHLTDAFGVALDLGDDIEAARAVSSLAQVHLGTGKADVAETQARKALELLPERADTIEDCGSAQLVLGRALLDQARLDEASVALDAAESLFGQLSSASHVASAWVAKGDLAQARGDDAAAAKLYRRAAEALQDYRF